jgi:hypothetical protein
MKRKTVKNVASRVVATICQKKNFILHAEVTIPNSQ